jgi:hypothetical protein
MDRYGAPAHGPDTPYFAAYTITVADMDATAAVLRSNGVVWRRRGDSIVVDAGAAFGVLLEFVGET